MVEQLRLAAVGPEVDPEIVESLERLLEKAKAGQIRGIIYSALLPGYQTNSVILATDDRDATHLLGCASRLVNKLHAILDRFE